MPVYNERLQPIGTVEFGKITPIESEKDIIVQPCPNGDGGFIQPDGTCSASGVPPSQENKPEVSTQPQPPTPTEQVQKPFDTSWHWANIFPTAEPFSFQRIETPYATAQDIYRNYDIPVDRDILPSEWFNHNVPLALWLPDGTVVKADTEEEFAELVKYAESNRKYLPSVSEYPVTPTAPMSMISMVDLRDEVEAQRGLDTPEKQKLEYWKIQSRRLAEYNDNLAKYKSIVETLPTGVTASDLKGMAAIYQDRVKRQTGRYNAYTQDEIESNLNQANNEYIASLTPKLPKEISLTPELNIQTPENWAPTAQEIDEFKSWATDNQTLLNNYLQKAGDRPETRAIIKSIYPDISDDVIDQYYNTAKPSILNRDPLQGFQQVLGLIAGTDDAFAQFVQSLVGSAIGKGKETVGKMGVELPSAEINMPSKSGNLRTMAGLYRDIGVMPETEQIPTRTMGVHETLEWFSPQQILLMFVGGKVGVSAAQKSLPDVVLMLDQGFNREAIGKALTGIVKGNEIENIIVQAERLRAVSPEIAREWASIVVKHGWNTPEAANAFKQMITSHKTEIKLPPRPVEVKLGEPFDPNVKYQVGQDGKTYKIESPIYREAKPNEPLAEPYIDDAGKVYVKKEATPIEPVTPKTAQQAEKGALGTEQGTKIPTEPIKTEAPVGETVVSEKMAEIDIKLTDVKTRIKTAIDKGILEKGAINDPESKQLYDDLVEAAGLYIQKGILTVEEFAKELGVKVTDAVKKAWDDVSQARAETSELNKTLGLPDEVKITPQRRVLSDAEMKSAEDEIIKRLNAASEVLIERKESVKSLRKQQAAAGIAAREEAGGGEAGFLAGRGAMKGEAEKVYTGLGKAEFDQATRDWIIDAPRRAYIKNPAIFYKSKKGEFFTTGNAQEALLDLIEGKSLQQGQIRLLEKVYSVNAIKAIKNTPKDILMDILGLPKTILSSIDHSFPGRQGWVINSSNPEIAVKNIKDATGAFWSEKYAAKLKESVLGDPEFKIASEAGIDFTDTGLARVAREESFPSRFAEKIPGIKQSSRSYTWAANAQRLSAWKKYKSWLGNDATTKDMESLAEIINLATGRGDLGRLNAVAAELNTILFSPKLTWARIQLPLKSIPMTRNPRMRAIYWRNVGTSIGVSLTTIGLFKAISEIPAMKDKVFVESDMRSSDFGKVIVGDTHLDVTGGNAQLIYLIARVITNTRVSGGGVEYETTGLEEAMRYLRYKSAPVMGFVYDILTRKSVSGKKFGSRDYWSEKVPGSTVPMGLQDAIDAFFSYGMGGALMTLPLVVYGIGASTYESVATTQEKRLGTNKYSDDQLSDKTIEAKNKYIKSSGDALGELAVQAKLDKLADEYYTLVDFRSYLRRSGAKDYRSTPLQEYFNECIPLFDKWDQDTAATGKKFTYTEAEKTQLLFWGIAKTGVGNKSEARKWLQSLGLPKEAAPWLY